MNGLFGGGASTVTAAAAPSGASSRPQPAGAQAAEAGVDANALLTGAARDLADYQRLTAEGKLGEAGRKLEDLKRKLDQLAGPNGR